MCRVSTSGNYATYFVWWDRLFGTDQAFEAFERARKKREAEAQQQQQQQVDNRAPRESGVNTQQVSDARITMPAVSAGVAASMNRRRSW